MRGEDILKWQMVHNSKPTLWMIPISFYLQFQKLSQSRRQEAPVNSPSSLLHSQMQQQ